MIYIPVQRTNINLLQYFLVTIVKKKKKKKIVNPLGTQIPANFSDDTEDEEYWETELAHIRKDVSGPPASIFTVLQVYKNSI